MSHGDALHTYMGMPSMGRGRHSFNPWKASAQMKTLRKPPPHIGVPLIGGQKYVGDRRLQKGVAMYHRGSDPLCGWVQGVQHK